jgi:hypothetical protein
MRRRTLVMAAALLAAGGAIHLALVAFHRDRVFGDGVSERTQAQYDAVRGGVHTLILGSSHAKWGIAADALEDAFNLSLGGQTAPESYYVLRSELADPTVDLHTVILPADSVTFSDWQSGVFGYRHWYAPRVDYAAIGRRRGRPLLYAANGFLGEWAPYAGQRRQILSYLNTGISPQLAAHIGLAMNRGSFSSSDSWAKEPAEKRRATADERARLHFPEPGFDEVAGEYLRRTLELAREEGLRVLLVRFPLSMEYLLASRPFMESADVDAHLEEILADHPEVQVLDARLDYAGLPRLFVDPDHLNQRGARLLTRRVRRILDGTDG